MKESKERKRQRAMFAKLGMAKVPKHISKTILEKHNGVIQHKNPRTKRVETVKNPQWRKLKNGSIAIIYTGHDGKPVSKIVG